MGNFRWSEKPYDFLVIPSEQGVVADCIKLRFWYNAEDAAKKLVLSNPFLDVHMYDRDKQEWYIGNKYYESGRIKWHKVASTSVPNAVRMATLIIG